MRDSGSSITVLFDSDGTPTDPLVGISPAAAFDYRSPIGPPIRANFETLLGPDPVSNHDGPVALFRARYADIGLFQNTPYADAGTMLERESLAASRTVFFAEPAAVTAQALRELFEERS